MIVETDAKRPSYGKIARRTDQQREPKHSKGETMKKKYASILFTLICLLGVGVAAQAQTRGEIVVTLPFEFVISGKTLPAGTYTVSRFSDDKNDGVILSNRDSESGKSVFVHPIETEDTSADKPQVSFERVGELHFLTRIQTSHDVYKIPVSRSEILEAAARPHDNGSASGSSGSN
jgi:hypothetical protein